jgi:hypothetical protein
VPGSNNGTASKPSATALTAAITGPTQQFIYRDLLGFVYLPALAPLRDAGTVFASHGRRHDGRGKLDRRRRP